MRLTRFATSIGLSAMIGAMAAPAMAQEMPTNFSIDPMPLSSALKTYAIQSGDQVLVPSDLTATIKSQGAVGPMTRKQALDHILEGTGFVAVRSPSGVISLRRQAPAKPVLTAARSMAVAQAAPAASAPTPAAQNEPVGGGEIIVTARKRSERLIDIPASIAALDEEFLKDARVERVDDLSTHVPNLTIVTRTDATPDVTLRGIGSFGVIQTVGFYVNDVQQFDGQTSRFRDIERIEVLKGPQGTLYSGSNIGGAIRLVTKRPTSTFEGEMAVEYGSYDFISAEAIVSGPLTDSLGARLMLYGDRSDGFAYNLATDKKAGPNWIYGGRLTLELAAGADTTATLFVDVNEQERRDLTNLYITTDDDTYSKDINQDYQPRLVRRIQSATLDIRHDFGGMELVSLTSGFHSYDRKFADFDFTEVDFLQVDALRKNDAISQELRLGSTGSRTFNWLLGAFGQYFERSNRTDIFVVGDLYDARAHDRKRQQLAVFGNGEIDLGDFTIEAGVRYEWDSNKLTVLTTDDSGKVTANELLYRGALSYKPSPDLTLYTAVAKGFTPGDLVAEGGFAIPYDKETATSIEAGLKGTGADGRLRFEAAAFAIWYDDRLFQTNVFREETDYVTVTNNIGDSRNLGFEVSASFDASENFTFGGAFGYTDGKWTEAIISEPNSGDEEFDLDGFDVPFTPDYQASVFADWSTPISGDAELGLHADVSFTGRKYWNLATTTQQRAYQLVNLSARLEMPRWELSLNAKNLFDEPYNTLYQTAAEIGNDAGDGFAVYGQPRQITATLRTYF